jgi:aspartate aminotransferase
VLERAERRYGRRIYLISDEPYRDLIYGTEPFTSPASVHPNSFMCYSWSKSFSVPGERIGYLAVNPAMHVNDWGRFVGTLAMCNRILGFINAPAFMQRVVGKSLGCTIDVEHYRLKRDRLCSALSRAGYEFPVPEGAFYVFVRSPEPEEEFVARAKRHLLLAVPGAGFGSPGYFRLCYAVPESVVELACSLLSNIMEEIQ